MAAMNKKGKKSGDDLLANKVFGKSTKGKGTKATGKAAPKKGGKK